MKRHLVVTYHRGYFSFDIVLSASERGAVERVSGHRCGHKVCLSSNDQRTGEFDEMVNAFYQKTDGEIETKFQRNMRRAVAS